MTWESPQLSNYSQVNFYCYEIIAEEDELPVQNLVFNTTDTEVVLKVSEIPRNIEISFVFSAYNCQGASSQLALIINIQGKYNEPQMIHGMQLYTCLLKWMPQCITHYECKNFSQNLVIIFTAVRTYCTYVHECILFEHELW